MHVESARQGNFSETDLRCRACLAERAYDLRDEARTFARRGVRFSIVAAICGVLISLMFDQHTYLAPYVVLHALYVLGPLALAAGLVMFAIAGARRWASVRVEREGGSVESEGVPYRKDGRCARHALERVEA
jgi:hypothetical protein